MKMMKYLESASVRATDSLFVSSGSTTNQKQTHTQSPRQKQKIRLNVGRAEKALLQKCSPETVAKPKRVRREPLERMQKIHRIVAAGKYPSAAQLAEELEVGVKTVRRDLEHMRDRYQFPLEYDPARYGFFYSKPVDGFPGAPCATEAELFALLVTSKAIEQYRGTPFYQPLVMAYQKLSRQLDSKERYSLEDLGQALSFRPFAPEDTDLKLFEILTRSRSERKVLQFEYRKPGVKEPSTRRVHPYHFTCCNNCWYLLAFDEAHSEVRTFALGRIKKPLLCDARFTRPRDFNPAKYLDGCFAIMKGEGDYEVVIEFNAFATDLLRGRRWHSTQQITELPNGACRLRMRLSCLEEVERWVLSWGTHATVIGPTALIDRISKTIHELASRYPAPSAIN